MSQCCGCCRSGLGGRHRIRCGRGLGTLRYEPGRPLFGIESLFNSGQTAMYVSTGAVIFAVLDALLDGRGGSTSGILMMVLAGIVMHLTNTFLVSTAGAIQTQVSPLRAWGVNIMIDLRPHAVMIAFGATAALALSVEPWVLPAIVLPFALTHLAVGQSIALREEERTALAALVDIVELRDPYTAGHSRRVAQPPVHWPANSGRPKKRPI